VLGDKQKYKREREREIERERVLTVCLLESKI
jgi:hypothetical protein